MQVSIVAWFLYALSKKLVFALVASTIDWRLQRLLVLVSDAQQPEIQYLVSRGQGHFR